MVFVLLAGAAILGHLRTLRKIPQRKNLNSAAAQQLFKLAQLIHVIRT